MIEVNTLNISILWNERNLVCHRGIPSIMYYNCARDEIGKEGSD